MNTIEFPVFAVDYRLAPEFKFPAGVYDVVASLLWIKQFVLDVLGVSIEEYVLMGDSAGANLAIAACQWLIESDIGFLPSMLSLAYPVTNIR